MARLTGWWTRRSNPEKVELYTRWTYHGLACVAVLISGLPALVATGEVGPVGGWLFLGVVLHTVVVAVLSSRALSWQLGRRERPKRLAAAAAALTAGGCVAVLVLRRAEPDADLQMSMYVVAGLASWGAGALALCTVRARHMLALAVATVAGLVGAATALGLPLTDTVPYAFSAAFGTFVFTSTSGFSGWLLRAVWELDAAHRLQARLAVAEERLRFARDLHDVMGRNLSVIALKSELAVQLARRGSADRAVDEMAEVQRIARESQREVRDVVRGYREADLHTELEGARGVLAA
ncbi:sensor histidine kinase, partial [Streptomyces roseolilacinus]|uniref:sensor histidine kinase n=1 Tax=Streptomyces roseolilacinus TaxID=66904 RepID=UPI00380B0F04